MADDADVSINVKLHRQGDERDFSLRLNCRESLYEMLKKRLHVEVPGDPGELAWIDDDGDLIRIGSSEELAEALRHINSSPDRLCIYAYRCKPPEQSETAVPNSEADKKSP